METFFCIFRTELCSLGHLQKEQIASYSSVTRKEFFLTQVLYFGGWGNEEGCGVIPILILFCPNFPPCLLQPPAAAFQGWLSITLTFLLPTVLLQLLYIRPHNSQRSDLIPLCFFCGWFLLINFPHCYLPISLLLCSLLLVPIQATKACSRNTQRQYTGISCLSFLLVVT